MNAPLEVELGELGTMTGQLIRTLHPDLPSQHVAAITDSLPQHYELQEQNFLKSDLTLSWPFYTGGKITAANQAAEVDLHLAQSKKEALSHQMFSELVRLYYGVRLADAVVQVRMEVVQGMEQHLHQAIRLDVRVPFNPYSNYFYFLAATLLPTMLHMFVITSAIYAFGSEPARSTARQWLEKAGGRAWIAIAAKILPYTLIFCIWGLFMNAFLFRMGVPMEGSGLLPRFKTALPQAGPLDASLYICPFTACTLSGFSASCSEYTATPSGRIYGNFFSFFFPFFWPPSVLRCACATCSGKGYPP
jgi:hypothetical protein